LPRCRHPRGKAPNTIVETSGHGRQKGMTARQDARGLVSLGRCRFVGFRTAAFGRKRLWLRLGRGRSSRFVLEGRFTRSRLPCRRRFHRRSYRRTLGGFACQGSLDDSRRLRRSLCSTLRRWLGCLRNLWRFLGDAGLRRAVWGPQAFARRMLDFMFGHCRLPCDVAIRTCRRSVEGPRRRRSSRRPRRCPPPA